MVAVLDGGPDAAVSHRAAATLLGTARRDAPEVVEITVTRRRNTRLDGVVVHRSRDLVPDHVLTVDGLPCTGPLRTLVDLGAVEPRWVVADAFERALQSGQVTVLGAEWMLTNLSRRGRDGCGVFRRVLDDRALMGASPHPGLLEPRMARIFKGSTLPAPEYQYKCTTSRVRSSPCRTSPIRPSTRPSRVHTRRRDDRQYTQNGDEGAVAIKLPLGNMARCRTTRPPWTTSPSCCGTSSISRA